MSSAVRAAAFPLTAEASGGLARFARPPSLFDLQSAKIQKSQSAAFAASASDGRPTPPRVKIASISAAL